MLQDTKEMVRQVWECLQQFSLHRAIIFVIQLILVVYLSFLTPFFVRYALAAKFVERTEPLEFTFQTCRPDLEGVCSFPEAVVAIEEDGVELLVGYHHSFTLHFSLFDTPQNRQLGVFIASIQVKDEGMKVLAGQNKGVSVLKAFPPRQSFLYGLYVHARNLMFLPLYLCGFFSDEAAVETSVSVKFPSQYLEKQSRRSKFIIVQLQNKFIQISSSSLGIRAHVGLLCYLISEYPLCSYLFLLLISFSLYFTLFAFHWTYKGINLFCSNRENNKRKIVGSDGGKTTKQVKDPGPTKNPKMKDNLQLDHQPSSSPPARTNVWYEEKEVVKRRNGFNNKAELPECPILTNIHGWDVGRR